MIIDTHVHFWDPSRKDDILLLRREPSMVKRFYPDDLKPLLMSIKANRCIVIQSAPHPSETDNLIEITKDLNWIHGIVGWADLEASNISEILILLSSISSYLKIQQISNYSISYKLIFLIKYSSFNFSPLFIRPLEYAINP